MSNWISVLIEELKNTSLLEWLGVIFGVAQVLLAKANKVWLYPTGIISVTISIYIFATSGLYAESVLNIYYLVMSIYGWWNWARKKNNQSIVKVSRTNTKEKIIGIGLFVLTMLVTYSVYKAYGYKLETANYIDIVTSGIFFTAMWYMATKKLENWTLWIIGDLITVPLYAHRGLGMLSLQYVIFTILAIQGYRLWKKNLNNNQQTV